MGVTQSIDENAIFSLDGVNVSFLKDFIISCGGRELICKFTVQEICDKYILPHTYTTVVKDELYENNMDSNCKFKSLSYCELMRKQQLTSVGTSTVYISSTSNTSKYMSDLIKLNIPKVIQSIGYTVMVITPKPNTVSLILGRTWCLYELYLTNNNATSSKFEIAMSKEQTQRFLEESLINANHLIQPFIQNIVVEESKSTQLNDNIAIMNVILNNIGISGFNSMISDLLQDWVIKTCQLSLTSCTKDFNSNIKCNNKEFQKTISLMDILSKVLIIRIKRCNQSNCLKYYEILCNLAFKYSHMKRFIQAEELYRSCVTITSLHLGIDHIHTLQSIHNLSAICTILGKYNEAEDLFQQYMTRSAAIGVTLKNNNHTIGSCLSLVSNLTLSDINNVDCNLNNTNNKNQDSDQINIEFSIRNISTSIADDYSTTFNAIRAQIYAQTGRFEEAENLLRSDLLNRQNLINQFDLETIQIKHNLAVILSSNGNIEESSKLFEEILLNQSVILGENHKETINTINNLATVHKSIGQVDIAEKYYKECINRVILSVGYDHEDYINSLHNLIIFYKNLGRYDDLLPLCKEYHKKVSDVLGEDHIRILTALNHLASCYFSLDNIELAETYYWQCITNSKLILGENHSSTLIATQNLAGLFSNTGRHIQAKPLYRDCLQKSIFILGPNHSSTLTAISNLAVTLANLGEYGEAEQLYLECLKKSSSLLGDYDPNTLIAMSNLALLYANMNQLEEAEKLYLKCLLKRTAVLSAIHPDTIQTAQNLATCYATMNNFQDALSLFHDCLTKRTQLLGESHSDTLLLMNNIAALYKTIGNLEESERYYLECYRRKKLVLGDNHPSTLHTMTNLANLHSAMNKMEEAVLLHTDCLGRRINVYGDCDPYTLQSMNYLAVTLYQMGKYLQAEPIQRECFVKRSIHLGDNHSDTLNSMHNLATIFSSLPEKMEESEILYEDCLDRMSIIFGENNPQTQLCRNNLIKLQEMKWKRINNELVALEHSPIKINENNIILGEESFSENNSIDKNENSILYNNSSSDTEKIFYSPLSSYNNSDSSLRQDGLSP
eukprot:gene7506-10227_t